MIRLAPILLALAACAAPTALAPHRDRLAPLVAGRVAGPPRACLAIRTGQGLTIVDRQTLAYRIGGTVWVNRLEQSCGFDPTDTLIVESFAGQYCRGDRVRGLEPGSRIPGPTCLLNAFTPWSRPR